MLTYFRLKLTKFFVNSALAIFEKIMPKRIFIAIKIQPQLYPVITRWRKSYFGKLPVRWIKEKNLHITLVPPWYEPEDKIDNLTNKVEEGLRGFEPFKVLFERVCFGPDEKRPRLIWAEGEASEEILALKRKVEEILHKTPEKRDFKLHLTLARFGSEEFKKFSVKTLDDRVFWEQKVDSFCLFESKLSPEGAEYEVLGTFKLA